MIKFKFLLREDIPSEKEIEKFENLKGSYSFQGHISNEKEIELKNYNPEEVVSNPYSLMTVGGNIINKPVAFWTSSIFKDIDSFKTKWSEFGSNSRSLTGYFHAYTVNGSCSILHIDNDKLVKDVFQKYGHDKGYLKYNEISKDYDGVHVFDEALENDKFELWSIESTAWFKPDDCLKKQFVWKIND